MQNRKKQDLLSSLDRNERIEFPVDFDLKVILDATMPDTEHTSNITKILNDLQIPHSQWRKKFSLRARYISFTIGVRLSSYAQMQSLYLGLREVPGVKYAL